LVSAKDKVTHAVKSISPSSSLLAGRCDAVDDELREQCESSLPTRGCLSTDEAPRHQPAVPVTPGDRGGGGTSAGSQGAVQTAAQAG